MSIRELAERSRSYRGYDRTRRISREELLEMVDITRFCPTSINGQVLKYYVTGDEEMVSRIHPLTGWAMALKEVHLPFPGKEPVAFILICLDRSLMLNGVEYLRDVGAAAQTILLAAVEKGLGGIMLGSFNRKKIAELLELPENLEPNLLLALGKPDENIVLTDIGEDGSIKYYRSEDLQTHYVPKRKLEDILIK